MRPSYPIIMKLLYLLITQMSADVTVSLSLTCPSGLLNRQCSSGSLDRSRAKWQEAQMRKLSFTGPTWMVCHACVHLLCVRAHMCVRDSERKKELRALLTVFNACFPSQEVSCDWYSPSFVPLWWFDSCLKGYLLFSDNFSVSNDLFGHST